ncbi:MAG: hypothetical protein GX931_03755 [Acholeplasmataceae bacterium]|jgi:hypothetical protein|nr:hypothetical protein [Acholeplasmataceae bacterium]
MKSYVNWMEGNSKLVKVLLALPIINILWWVYRLFKSIEKGHTLGIVLAIILLIVGIPFLWLLDLITLIVLDKVLWFS